MQEVRKAMSTVFILEGTKGLVAVDEEGFQIEAKDFKEVVDKLREGYKNKSQLVVSQVLEDGSERVDTDVYREKLKKMGVLKHWK